MTSQDESFMLDIARYIQERVNIAACWIVSTLGNTYLSLILALCTIPAALYLLQHQYHFVVTNMNMRYFLLNFRGLTQFQLCFSLSQFDTLPMTSGDSPQMGLRTWVGRPMSMYAWADTLIIHCILVLCCCIPVLKYHPKLHLHFNFFLLHSKNLWLLGDYYTCTAFEHVGVKVSVVCTL